ncbi:TPA: hypothetical protein ACF2DS_002445 [Clostridium perfringens]|uniref:hypothetical protein n=1 Tax=Clostridium perfringens TaxID=1502 RepID=UPI000F543223|nr:hypothetical protein [Clostridium perfringens]EJT6339284.1 hypothetical protein [Clostridium perfringens]MCX0380116.1 hypothetical protein [Clostridium perfringens]MDG6885368.1 hypothetical protein [Clostridium perfringens]MDK0892271.1 hypothetical protein [Clostridium perfringens]UBK99082.1 hypothetical protein KLF26_07610 [Clostridium perfringens]
MKRCSYCGKVFNEKIEKDKRTKEHLFAKSLINLFPNENITFLKSGICFIDNNGQSINDVCAYCNNELLSSLDEPSKKFIEENFLSEFNSKSLLKVKFNYNIFSRWLIKTAFNYNRIYKLDNTWFENNIKFILNGEKNKNIYSIFAGLHIDLTPFGEKNLQYMPLSVVHNLKFYQSGAVAELLLKIKDKPLNFNNLNETYAFRFGNSMFILMLWDNDADLEYVQSIESVIEKLFPYKCIKNEDVILQRCNTAFPYLQNNMITGNVGIALGDKLLAQMFGKY